MKVLDLIYGLKGVAEEISYVISPGRELKKFMLKEARTKSPELREYEYAYFELNGPANPLIGSWDEEDDKRVAKYQAIVTKYQKEHPLCEVIIKKKINT